MRLTPLPQSFYRPSADEVARALLGHLLIRNTPHGICGGPIVETEAYLGRHDPASHCDGADYPEDNGSQWDHNPYRDDRKCKAQTNSSVV